MKFHLDVNSEGFCSCYESKFSICKHPGGLPWWLSSKESAGQCRRLGQPGNLTFRFPYYWVKLFVLRDLIHPKCPLHNLKDTSIPGLGRFPGEGNGNPLQYSCLENSMDSPWRCKKLDTTDHKHIQGEKNLVKFRHI